MSWNNIAQTEQNLAIVLNSFDWTSSSEIVESLIRDIKRQTELLPERAAKSILGRLRRKRRLDPMAHLAEALVQSGKSSSRSRARLCPSPGVPQIARRARRRERSGVPGFTMAAWGRVARARTELTVEGDRGFESTSLH
jgi:hypothetical protein